MTTYMERLTRSVDRYLADYSRDTKSVVSQISSHLRGGPSNPRRENEPEIIDAVEELQFQEYVRIYGGER